jgi:hypothetical protein
MRFVFLLFIYTCFTQTVLAQNEDYVEFLKRLKVIESVSIDSNIIEYNRFWKSFVTISRDSVISSNRGSGMFKSLFDDYRRPNTKPFFDKKFRIGDLVVEEHRSKEANDCIGFAKCIDGVPNIFFSFNESPSICSEALVFFREHEFAHFKLGHAGCGIDGPYKDSHGREFDADLEAAKSILVFSEGSRIIDFVIATLFTLNERQSRSHPSSFARAANLLKGLNTNSPKYW